MTGAISSTNNLKNRSNSSVHKKIIDHQGKHITNPKENLPSINYVQLEFRIRKDGVKTSYDQLSQPKHIILVEAVQ